MHVISLEFEYKLDIYLNPPIFICQKAEALNFFTGMLKQWPTSQESDMESGYI